MILIFFQNLDFKVFYSLIFFLKLWKFFIFDANLQKFLITFCFLFQTKNIGNLSYNWIWESSFFLMKLKMAEVMSKVKPKLFLISKVEKNWTEMLIINVRSIGICQKSCQLKEKTNAKRENKPKKRKQALKEKSRSK